MKPGETIRAQFTKPIYGGDFLAYHQAKALFAPFVLPGESAQVAIDEAKRQFARGTVATLETTSPNRVSPRCAHFGQCGGCHYQHAEYATQLGWKRVILEEAFRRAGVRFPAPITVVSGPAWEYRNRIRLAVNTYARQPQERLGFRARSSHEIIRIVECPISAPVLLASAHRVAMALHRNDCMDAVAEMEVMATPDQGSVMVTLFIHAAEDGERLKVALNAIYPELRDPVVGIGVAAKTGEESMRRVAYAGADALLYLVGDVEHSVPSGAFFQVNRWMLDTFQKLVTAEASGETAWDLYAGVGFFSRALESSFRCVDAVEASEASFASLKQALRNPDSRAILAPTVKFLEENRLRRDPAPDWIVLDPPRSGLDARTSSLLNAIHAPRMTYVSCDPITLSRDLGLLTEERFQIESVHLVDLFPQTFHFESVVQLKRCR